MHKKDIFVAALAGLLIGLFSIPTARNIELPLGLSEGKILLTALILALLTIIGFALLDFLSRWLAILHQVAKFIVVGGLNTFLDFAVLNFLIIASGVTAGLNYSIFKAISFSVAVINSYFWNKYWTFSLKGVRAGEFLEFFVISLIGFGLNVGTASLVVNVIGAPGGLNPTLWANAGALVATFVSLTWNFLGYKFLVFRKSTP
jgi:putative flippase GtrA